MQFMAVAAGAPDGIIIDFTVLGIPIFARIASRVENDHIRMGMHEPSTSHDLHGILAVDG
ncbi:MAG: hypothetical protein M0C28_43780 [Candidatus Moduliflexus flocculans]|nr:hypothetical protein [Candidatus Moduliflexus flocculans]